MGPTFGMLWASRRVAFVQLAHFLRRGCSTGSYNNRKQVSELVSGSGHVLDALTPSSKKKALQILRTQLRHRVTMWDADMVVSANFFDPAVPGTYVAALGGLPVFHSSDLVEVGLGWPTFRGVLDIDHIEEEIVMAGIPDMRQGPDLFFDRHFTMGPEMFGMVHHQIKDRRAGSLLGYAIMVNGDKVYCVDEHALFFVDEADERHIPTKAWQVALHGSKQVVYLDNVEDVEDNPESVDIVTDLQLQMKLCEMQADIARLEAYHEKLKEILPELEENNSGEE